METEKDAWGDPVIRPEQTSSADPVVQLMLKVLAESEASGLALPVILERLELAIPAMARGAVEVAISRMKAEGKLAGLDAAALEDVREKTTAQCEWMFLEKGVTASQIWKATSVSAVRN